MSGNKALTHAVALDCEMVGAGSRGSISMVARVSVVNEYYYCLYDTYVLPTRPVTDYRTPVSGIKPNHLKSGRPLDEVKKVVADQLRGGILVGHDVQKDLKVMRLCHPHWKIRDTAYYPPIRSNPNYKPSLKYLAAEYAGMNIQNGYHDSVRDARAAMMVYKQFEDDWEEWLDEYESSAASLKKSKSENDSLWRGDYYHTDIKPKHDCIQGAASLKKSKSENDSLWRGDYYHTDIKPKRDFKY